MDADETIVTFALVLRMPLENIPGLKLILREDSSIKIVYQKVAAKELYITEEKNDE